MATSSEHVMNWRNRTKQRLIEYKGGKCERCGYDKIQYPRAFVFHHNDPSKKEMSLSKVCRALEKLKKEVDKCTLLCARCHAEIHDEADEKKRQFRLDIKPRTPRKLKLCKYCGTGFKTYHRKQKFCSVKCKAIGTRKVLNRPSKHVLKNMRKSMSLTSIGKKFGVTHGTIQKWLNVKC